jgi:signal transduction histidine kinase
MSEQGGVLEVTLTSVEVDLNFAQMHTDLHEGKYVRLTVSDTGHGMDRATIERMYEPFFTTKAPGKGTGLGLAVVHGVIKKHDGAIIVQSERGKGTTFHLYFPVYEAGPQFRSLDYQQFHAPRPDPTSGAQDPSVHPES